MSPTPIDLLNVLGIGFEFTLGELVIELLNASENPDDGHAERALELLERLRGYRASPSAPMPLATIGAFLAQLGGKAEPRYAALVVKLWAARWDPGEARQALYLIIADRKSM